MFPISLVMIVKDEEEVLEDCLKSVQGIVSQIVIVDTGSTDGTLNIARNYTDDIFHFEWVNDFSAARNYGLGKATQPWILSLDADERIEWWDPQELRQLLNENYVISFRSIHEFHRGEQLLEQIVYQPRLFPNKCEYRYFERIHEELRFQGGPIKTKRTEITFRHIGYRKNRIKSKDKINRNINIHLIEFQKSPNDPSHLHRAAKTCLNAKDYEQAKVLYEKIIDFENLDLKTFASVLVDYCYLCKFLNEEEEALNILLSNIEPIRDYADAWYLAGLLFLSRKTIEDAKNALHCFHNCIEIGENSNYDEHMLGTGSFLAYYNLGLIYEILGDSRAFDFFNKSSMLGYDNATDKMKSFGQ